MSGLGCEFRVMNDSTEGGIENIFRNPVEFVIFFDVQLSFGEVKIHFMRPSQQWVIFHCKLSSLAFVGKQPSTIVNSKLAGYAASD